MRATITLLVLSACVAFGGVAFGVNPIGPMPETYLGYKVGPIVPYLSLSFINHSAHLNYYDESYDEWIDDTTHYEDEEEVTWKGSILAPTLGGKFVMGTSDLKPFFRISGSMPFLLSLDATVDDPDYQEDIDTALTQIKDGLKPFFLLTAGAGVEYFLSENFSIGGEFNYRLLTGGWEYEYYDEWVEEYIDPVTGDTLYFDHWDREEINLGGIIGGTCAGMWLNYYF